MAYATQTDLTDRYGTDEIIQLTDRGPTQTNAIVTSLLDAKIADAENEINKKISCCWDIKKIKSYIAGSVFVPLLRTWTSKITRKNLYDSIRIGPSAGGSDHQAQREYEEVIKEIESFCKCGDLLDSEDNVIPRKKKFVLEVDEPGCYPKRECCLTQEACCE